MEKKRIST